MLLLDSLELFIYPTAIIMKKPSFYIKRLFLIAFLLMTLSTQANTQLANTTLQPTIEILHCESNSNIFEATITVSLISTVVLLSPNLLFVVVL